jgi:excisionase family DNA binding protein
MQMTISATRQPPLTLTEAAAYTNLSGRFLRREIQRRRISVVRLGRTLRFEARDLEVYLDRNRVPMQAESP